MLMSMMPAGLIVLSCLLCNEAGAQAPGPDARAEGGPYSWTAADRAQRVAALIPGRRVPRYAPETLFAEWTAGQVARWQRDNPALDPDEAYRRYAATEPTDAALTADFPRHISPFARVRSGDVPAAQREEALLSYCVFCRSLTMSVVFDQQNPWQATTSCCRTELLGREEDFPPDYPLAPTDTARFLHLDENWVEAPCTVYRDAEGAEWELFIPTLFHHRRWVRDGCDLVRQYGRRFEESADPLFAHKIAVILDEVADTYYALPLSFKNELATGRDGGPLTREEWEAVPRPAIFEVSYLGPWNRRLPLGSKGWLNMFDEHIWVEPFARVRHHPAFRHYSQVKYGDPDALDRKVRTKLLREVGLMFKSVFSQKLLTNYQEANYVDMWLLGLLLEDDELIDFAGPNQELAMYNHSYQDGLNGEGAPNYMAMPGGYFYPFLADPKGWLQYDPTFLEDNPFYHAAAGEMRKLTTVRGIQIEFGDQHVHAFPGHFRTRHEDVAAAEKTGSRNWPGYGVGILRVGGPGRRQEVSLLYTRATLHNAQDALSMEYWVDGVPVMRRGGYAAWWTNAHLQWDRPGVQALREMGYPTEITEGERAFSGWSWVYAHNPMCQNGVMVDDIATGRGWGDDRGYGEVITFKGGEAAGAPGSGFQVLDVRDHYSWSRVDLDVPDFRRTLIGVEGPDGRPYVLDIQKLSGGRSHTQYNSAWGERAEDALPETRSDAATLAEALFGAELPEDTPHFRTFRHIRNVERLAAPGNTWDLTWKTDMAAYAPRPADDRPLQRPIPEDVGRVRLRMLGMTEADGRTELLRASGPWIAWMRQPLPGGGRIDGNVAFLDGRDFLIERREADADEPPLESLFIHVMEGFPEGEASAIRSVERLEAVSTAGGERDVVVLRLALEAGHTDTVIYQSEKGAVRLPDGLETDARYALIRRAADGDVPAVETVRSTFLRAEGFEGEMRGDLTGTVVDLVGDVTGTRRESALIIRPDEPWPGGEHLADRQLLVRVDSDLRDPCKEGFRIQAVRALPDGLVRVDLQDYAPFAVSWHQVTMLPEDRPNVILTNRPMVSHGNAPWYRGINIWFPEHDRTLTIRSVNRVGGGYGGDTLEVLEDVNLAEEGIRVGDWYVIYLVRPGMEVTVPNDLSWRREPRDWEQYALRATGAVSVDTPATRTALHHQDADGGWHESPGGKWRFSEDDTAGRAVRLVADKPAWLDLADEAPPEVARIALDGEEVPVAQARDVGWIDPPRQLTVEVRDAHNPLDPGSLSVAFDGRRVDEPDAGVITVEQTEEGRALTVTVDLEAALRESDEESVRHTLRVEVAENSVHRERVTGTVSFMIKIPGEEGAVYLSDLDPVRSWAHGGLKRDMDYVGNPAQIAGRLYPKCLTLCPGVHAEGNHGQAVYRLPEEPPNPVLRADIGISDSASGRGSVEFMVQASDSAEGPWETLYLSPVLRGGQDPLLIGISLGDAPYLRLFTTDAGDGINSDHALWGNARLME